MTETSTTIGPRPNAEPAPPIPQDPSEVLLNLVATLLAPMFLGVSGDIALARAAALQTINAYRVREQAGMLAVAQIVAFGLAALGSLSLSMADDISLSTRLRLRGNANALNRAAEQNRRALQASHPAHAAPVPLAAFTQAATMDAEDLRQEQQVIAGVAAAQQAAAAATQSRRPAERQSAVQPAAPAATPTLTTPDVAAPKPVAQNPPASLTSAQEQHRRAMWAAAIANVAGEFTASLPHLPPAERKLTMQKAAAMSGSVTALLSGEPLPRPHPGDLGPLLRRNAT